MPTDPNARRDKALSDITQALTKTNRLLEAQNKILEKMEKHARPTPMGGLTLGQHPYLERSATPSDGDDYVGPYGSGPSQDGR